MLKYQPFNEGAIYSPPEVAKETPFSEKTLAKWRWLGCGPEYRKLHGRIFYCGSALNAWIASAETGGTRAPAVAA